MLKSVKPIFSHVPSILSPWYLSPNAKKRASAPAYLEKCESRASCQSRRRAEGLPAWAWLSGGKPGKRLSPLVFIACERSPAKAARTGYPPFSTTATRGDPTVPVCELLISLTHDQRESHTVAHGRCTRTRRARYCQRVGSGGGSRVMLRTPTSPSAATCCQRQT